MRFVKFWRIEKTNIQLPTTFYETDTNSGCNIKHDQKNPVKCFWHTYSRKNDKYFRFIFSIQIEVSTYSISNMHFIHWIDLLCVLYTIEKYHALWSTTAIYIMWLIGCNYHHEMHFLFSDYFAHAKNRLQYKKEVIYLKYRQFIWRIYWWNLEHVMLS